MSFYHEGRTKCTLGERTIYAAREGYKTRRGAENEVTAGIRGTRKRRKYREWFLSEVPV